MSWLTPRERTPFLLPADQVADQSGYILWTDSMVVLFHKNDVQCMPQNPRRN
jgi:hypothetical protein